MGDDVGGRTWNLSVDVFSAGSLAELEDGEEVREEGARNERQPLLESPGRSWGAPVLPRTARLQDPCCGRPRLYTAYNVE